MRFPLPRRDGHQPAPSGEQVDIAFRDQRAVAVSVGAGLREYTVAGEPVLDGYGPEDMCDGGRGQLLIPWPNRIRDGTYTWQGRRLQLPLTEPEKGNAIHGLARWMPWRLANRVANGCGFELDLAPQPGYPFQLRLFAAYRLSDKGLHAGVVVTNLGGDPCPVGAGAHPYLTVGTDSVDDVRLRVPAERRLLTDDRQIPVGDEAVDGTEFDFRAGSAIGPRVLDTAFTDLRRDADGRCRVSLSAPSGRAVTLWMSRECTHVMVFTGDTLAPARRRRSVAVEPMTCPPNAFAAGAGIRVLKPGESFKVSWGIALGGQD